MRKFVFFWAKGHNKSHFWLKSDKNPNKHCFFAKNIFSYQQRWGIIIWLKILRR